MCVRDEESRTVIVFKNKKVFEHPSPIVLRRLQTRARGREKKNNLKRRAGRNSERNGRSSDARFRPRVTGFENERKFDSFRFDRATWRLTYFSTYARWL